MKIEALLRQKPDYKTNSVAQEMLFFGLKKKSIRTMKVEIFTFCEFACHNRGSLSIQGVFDSITPEKNAVFYTAIRIRMSLERPMGECLLMTLDPAGELVSEPLSLSVSGPTSNFVIRNKNMKLTQQGVYHSVLRDEEKVIASLPLFMGNHRTGSQSGMEVLRCLN